MQAVHCRRIVSLLTESHCKREAARLDLRDAASADDMSVVLVASICYFSLVREYDGVARGLAAAMGDDVLFQRLSNEAAEACTDDRIATLRAKTRFELRRRLIEFLERSV